MAALHNAGGQNIFIIACSGIVENAIKNARYRMNTGRLTVVVPRGIEPLLQE
jgi:hypothetical protein